MNITVFCGSAFGNDKAYMEETVKLAEWIASQGHTLVYGGTEQGLMGVLSDTVLSCGGKVIGVIPGDGPLCSLKHPHLTDCIITADVAERKKKMIELADVCIALPGGIGTFDEISEVIALNKIGVIDMPCVLFNTNGFYSDMKAVVVGMLAAGFATMDHFRNVIVSNDLEEIEAFVEGK